MATLVTRMALQRQRRAQLDLIRVERGLTAEEQAESDRLTDRLYMREWRRNFRSDSPGATRHAP